MKNGSFLDRCGYAFAGVVTVFRREKSFRMHCGFALLAIAVAAFTQPDLIWWAIVGLCIAIVFAAEMVNASLEYLIDRLHPEIHEEIRHAKDAAAGAVLLASIGTACVGVLMIVDWWFRAPG
ncbi:MAG TPA: diacylglycerol kinase [Allosphingosinicella sp.]|nr:diacylglycerol kinase [Allosphingosinicella sp.]